MPSLQITIFILIKTKIMFLTRIDIVTNNKMLSKSPIYDKYNFPEVNKKYQTILIYTFPLNIYKLKHKYCIQNVLKLNDLYVSLEQSKGELYIESFNCKHFDLRDRKLALSRFNTNSVNILLK